MAFSVFYNDLVAQFTSASSVKTLDIAFPPSIPAGAVIVVNVKSTRHINTPTGYAGFFHDNAGVYGHLKLFTFMKVAAGDDIGFAVTAIDAATGQPASQQNSNRLSAYVTVYTNPAGLELSGVAPVSVGGVDDPITMPSMAESGEYLAHFCEGHILGNARDGETPVMIDAASDSRWNLLPATANNSGRMGGGYIELDGEATPGLVINLSRDGGYSGSRQTAAQMVAIKALYSASPVTAAPDNLVQSHSIDVVTATLPSVSVSAFPDGVFQSQFVQGAAASVRFAAMIDDIAQGQFIDAVTAVKGYVVVVDDLSQSHVVDEGAALSGVVVAPDRVVNAQGVEAVVIAAAGLVVANRLAQSQSLDSSSAYSNVVAQLESLITQQVLDGVTLGVSAFTAEPQKLTQSTIITEPAATGYYIVEIDDLTQRQIVDIASDGGLIVGALDGEIVIYPLLSGELKIY